MGYAHDASNNEMIANVPFSHLVAVYQAAMFDESEVKLILERTGYDEAANAQWPVVQRELTFVKNWLEKYAPENVKFAVADTLPIVELSEDQMAFLKKLALTIETEKDLNGQGMHDAIYAASQVANLKPGQAFEALYKVILGQISGPKAGWFLASLDQAWLLHRLREASER
jgi:lysyl-tRNA synthetase class 1